MASSNGGRPPRAEAASISLHVRLSPLELRRAIDAATLNHQKVGEFIRDAILEAAADCLDPLPPDRRGVS